MADYKDIKKIDFANISDSGNEGTKVAVGTTAQRGADTGEIRFNSTLNALEYRNADGYFDIDDAPTVSSANVTEIDSQAGGTQTINITGANFISGVTVKFIGSNGSQITASSTTRNSRTSLTCTVGRSSFVNAAEPYDIRVINPNGKSADLSNYINVDTAPSWTTASGNLADIGMLDTGNHATVAASDPDGDAIAYSLASGSLGGLSIGSSNGIISGNPTDVAADTTYNFTLRATANSKTADRAFNIIVRKEFAAGNQSFTNLDDFMQELSGLDTSLTDGGGALTLNGSSVGNYEYYSTTSNQTITTSTNMNTFFSNTKDTRSSIMVFGGNLTINSGAIFIPPVRKLFTAIYVAGNLVVNGQISMSARGANHSGTGDSGGYTAPAPIRMRSNGETIPATGGSGAGRNTGSTGANGSAGGTATRGSGGGGSGGHKYKHNSLNYGGGAGASGTSFSSGGGGGGNDYFTQTGGDAVANGGSGGGNGGAAGGGAGNPSVTGYVQGSTADYHPNGTGGTLIIFCEGSLSGSGSCRARSHEGTTNIQQNLRGGGGAGGGIVQIFTNSGSISTDVRYGSGAVAGDGDGGNGGQGAANIYTGYSG